MTVLSNRCVLRSDKRRRYIAAIVFLLFVSFTNLLAAPASSGEAVSVVKGWLRQRPEMLQSRLDRSSRRMKKAAQSGADGSVRTIHNADGEAIYHIVDLQPAGFVIVSADDEIEPIIAFSSNGQFDPDSSRTLAQLVRVDLPGRVNVVRGKRSWARSAGAAAIRSHRQRAKERWGRLKGLGAGAVLNDDTESLVSTAFVEPEDIRVAPLMLSTWSQGNVASEWCYNYYTPNHYVCGCMATAMAQLMRHFRYPDHGVGTASFAFYVDGALQYGNLRGGDGNGGLYDWDRMVLNPGSSMTLQQRQAIGGLCYDTGIAVNMSYASGGSGAYMGRAKSALLDVFGYANAVITYNNGESYEALLVDMVNPNLDAGVPVMLAIHGDGGHAVVCDGYGFQSDTPYHHLNMGWGGMDDAWYNLPDVDAYYDFSTVEACIYNIDTEAGGEVVSGRVLDMTGQPLANVSVTAWTPGGEIAGTTVSGPNGIYAITHLTSDTSYTLTGDLDGVAFTAPVVSVGKSATWPAATGNRWGIDLSVTAMDGYGMMSIDVTPDHAPWTIAAHPGDYEGLLSGSGDFSSLVQGGNYTICFGQIDGFVVPEAITRTVVQESPAVFAGVYNGIPRLAISGHLVVVHSRNMVLAVTANDPDGAVPVLSMTTGPVGSAFIDHHDGSGTFTWTPAPADIGEHPVSLLTSDGALASTNTVLVQVLPNLPWPTETVVDTRRPEFLWEPIENATWYCIWINRNGRKFCSGWLQQANASWQPDFDFPGGGYTWWVSGWGPEIGYASWSPAADFSIPVMIPGASRPLTPNGVKQDFEATFEWEPVGEAAWYRVWLNRNGTRASSWWVKGATNSVCPEALTFGSYQWWVRTWNPDGYGPWSPSAEFAIGAAEPTSPSGGLEGSPVALAWNDAGCSQATWYQLWVNREGVTYWSAWVPRTETVDGGSGERLYSNLPVLPLATGTYTWWIRAWHTSGTGPWSAGMEFVVP